MTTDELLVERTDGVLRLVINRPDRRNALTNRLMTQMTEAFASVAGDRSLRLVVLTGAGDKAFCAGADLKDADSPFQSDFSRYRMPFADLLRAGRACDLPILGVMNGSCFAGGMGLFGLCDIVIAAEHAKFGLPEVKVGVYPMQVLAVLRDLIPQRILAEMCITGEPLTAAEARACGIVNKVVPAAELDAAASTLIERIRAVSPMALRRGKYAVRAMETMDFEQMIAFAETQVTPMAFTEDAKEGRAAFAERRPPDWPNC